MTHQQDRAGATAPSGAAPPRSGGSAAERDAAAGAFLHWGQRAARSGDLQVARRLLAWAVEADPTGEEAWLWRAATAAAPAEGIACLERVLALDPDNPRARVGLVDLRARCGHNRAVVQPASSGRSGRGARCGAAAMSLAVLAAGLVLAAGQTAVVGSQPSTPADPAGVGLETGPGWDDAAAPDAGHAEAKAPMQPIAPPAPPWAGRSSPAAQSADGVHTAGAGDVIAASRPQPQPGGQESATLTPPRSEDHEPGPPPLAPAPDRPWVAAHRPTALWSGPGEHARLFRPVEPGAHFQVARPQDGAMLHVWDPVARNYAYIEAVTVGPAEDPAREPPPAGPRREDRAADLTLAPRPFWSGTARVTMYTCVELGGCNRTASGIWPYEGVVAVDPRVIPLGSTVWIEGLGTFLAADTGSAVRGHHIDVFARDYNRAIQWGVRHRAAAAYRGR